MTRATAGPDRRWLLTVIIAFGAIVAAHLDVIPIWDAKAYFDCVERAVQQPFDLMNFRCADHPSVAYASMLGLTQYAAPWTPGLLIAANGAIGIVSIAAFYGLLRLVFVASGVEYGLLTALYALAPLFVAHAIFLNLDYAAAAFLVLFIYSLFARRFWLAGAFAAVLIFTRETGGAAYALATAAFVVTVWLRHDRPGPRRLGALRHELPVIVVPVAAMLAYLALYALRPNGYVYGAMGLFGDRLDFLRTINPADRSMRAFLSDIFVLNFQWLYSAVVLGGLCVAGVRVARHGRADVEDAPPTMFFWVLLGGLVYITTRYRGFNNARYVLMVSPVLIVVFYEALRSLIRSQAGRVSYLTLCALLVFSSNFRTFDLLSESVFGTFAFGSHRMLNMPSIVGGLKLDCLVYNLEFLQFQYLYADMMRDVRPQPGAVFLMGNAIYNFPPAIDGRRFALTADPAHAMPLVVARGDHDPQVLQAREGERFFYAAFANATNEELAGLQRRHQLVAVKRYDRDGYTLDLYTFQSHRLPS